MVTITPRGNRLFGLPANREWSSRDVPVERWEALRERVREIKLNTLQKMEKGGKADLETIEEVRSDFHDLQQALEESMPVFPDLKPRIDELREKSARVGERVIEYVFEYHAGPGDGDPLVRFPSLPNSDDWYSYTTENKLGERVHNLVEGFKKVEKRAVKSLQEPGPASKQSEGFLKRRAVSEVVEELFSEQQSNLAYIVAKASVVKEKGMHSRCSYRYITHP